LELVETPGGGCRILLVDGDDSLMGISKCFSSVDEAVEGVAALREVAGTGLLRTCTAERYAVLMLEDPVIDSALAVRNSRSQSKVVNRGS
jgi:hypothetical protein